MLELDDHNGTGRLDRNRDGQLRPRKHDGRVEQHEPDGHQRAVDTAGRARRASNRVASSPRRDSAMNPPPEFRMPMGCSGMRRAETYEISI